MENEGYDIIIGNEVNKLKEEINSSGKSVNASKYGFAEKMRNGYGDEIKKHLEFKPSTKQEPRVKRILNKIIKMFS